MPRTTQYDMVQVWKWKDENKGNAEIGRRLDPPTSGQNVGKLLRNNPRPTQSKPKGSDATSVETKPKPNQSEPQPKWFGDRITLASVMEKIANVQSRLEKVEHPRQRPEGKTVRDQILRVLVDGGAFTIAELEERTGANNAAVKKALSRMPDGVLGRGELCGDVRFALDRTGAYALGFFT